METDPNPSLFLRKTVALTKEINDRLGPRFNSYRRLKLALLDEIGWCFWCGVDVKDFVAEDGENTPPNVATIDHIIPRLYRAKGESVLKVLSCNACNVRRAGQDNKLLRIHTKKWTSPKPL